MTTVSRTLTTCLALVATLLAGAARATDAGAMRTLSPSVAKYEVRLNNLPFKAEATQTLSPLGPDRWRLELRVDSFLLDTVEFSEFRWDGDNCRTTPERYGYTRTGVGRNKQVELKFDHSAGVVTRTDKEGSTRFSLPRSTEDKLGHMLSVACRVARGARGDLEVKVAWDRDVRTLPYTVGATEKIATPVGTYDAFRVQRKRTDSDRVTTTWLAGGAGWQPVQMQHTEGDGRLFQLRLLELRH